MLIRLRRHKMQIQPMPRPLPNINLTPLPGIRIQCPPNRLRLIARHQTIRLTKRQIILPNHDINRTPKPPRLAYKLRIREKLADGESLFRRFGSGENERIEIRGAEETELISCNVVRNQIPVIEGGKACRVVFRSDNQIQTGKEVRLACGVDAESREHGGVEIVGILGCDGVREFGAEGVTYSYYMGKFCGSYGAGTEHLDEGVGDCNLEGGLNYLDGVWMGGGADAETVVGEGCVACCCGGVLVGIGAGVEVPA